MYCSQRANMYWHTNNVGVIRSLHCIRTHSHRIPTVVKFYNNTSQLWYGKLSRYGYLKTPLTLETTLDFLVYFITSPVL